MQDTLQLFQTAMILTLNMSAPPLLIATVLGLVISVAMTMFQLQEQTLPFIVKLAAVFCTLLALSRWMSTEVLQLMQQAFVLIPQAGH